MSTGEVAGIGGLEGVGSTVVVIKAVDVLVEVPGAAATAILSLTEEIFAGEPTTAALIFPALPDGAAGAVGGVAGVVGAGAEEAAIRYRRRIRADQRGRGLNDCGCDRIAAYRCRERAGAGVAGCATATTAHRLPDIVVEDLDF